MLKRRQITRDEHDDDDDVLVPRLLFPEMQLIDFYLQHPTWIRTVDSVRSTMENPDGRYCPSKTRAKNSELHFLNHWAVVRGPV